MFKKPDHVPPLPKRTVKEVTGTLWKIIVEHFETFSQHDQHDFFILRTPKHQQLRELAIEYLALAHPEGRLA